MEFEDTFLIKTHENVKMFCQKTARGNFLTNGEIKEH